MQTIDMKTLGTAALLLMTASATAQPFSQLKLGITGMTVTFTNGPNGSGASLSTVTSAGGGSFTGSWEFNFGNAAFKSGKIFGNNLTNGSGPFNDAGSTTLISVSGFLNFNLGSLTGGSFQFGVSNNGGGTDTIQGMFSNSGTSNISGTFGGPWSVSGLVIDSTFTDAGGDMLFGDNVDISLFANQIFSGAFSELFLADNGSNGDFDMIIHLPAPGSVALSIAAVGLVASRRRRA